MGLQITASNVTAIAEGLWGFDMPPHQVRLFGDAPSSTGPRSVIMMKRCSYDPQSKTLQFDADDVVALNIGTLQQTVAVAAFEPTDTGAATETVTSSKLALAYGPGDRAFLSLARRELSPEMYEAAEALLEGVRRRSSGDLKRGKAKNFSDTPDNFWYVIVQPRVQQLSITVRGTVAHFRPLAKLPIKDDRGNTLFKVSGKEDVDAALELIFHAERKHGVR